MRKEEIWAIDHSRIGGFFLEQPDVTATQSGFVFGDCRITVTALESQSFAQMRLPRTKVVFQGGDDAVNQIHGRFFLRFLSAGG